MKRPHSAGKRGVFSRVLMRAALALLLVASIARADDKTGGDGTLSETTFSDYTPLSSNLELARRLMSPLAAAQLSQLLAGKALAEQPLDLAEEKFLLYVPPQMPPQGYLLLVFVPPWDKLILPNGWAQVLDEYGIIFVTSARSGNEQSTLGRREPLALVAAANAMHRYQVNPERVYVSGFSGGSRVAMRLALAYPDLFRGAILNAGGDPIGNADTPLPPADLFERFQSGSHLVYVSGAQDTFNVDAAASSMESMQGWCVFNVEHQIKPFVDHDVAGPAALTRALDALLKPVTPETDRLAACRSAIAADLGASLKKAKALLADGKRDDAQKLLLDIDHRFGGLAAPRSVELSK